MTAEEIGEWIYAIRVEHLHLIPHLIRIRENSGGLPLLLDTWIRSGSQNYEEIKRDRFCEQISRLKDGMNDTTKIRLFKLSILHSKSNEDLATYLGMENIDEVLPFVDTLKDRRLFDSSSKWFHHEIIQKCIEDGISEECKQRYHGKAAHFYEELIKKRQYHTFSISFPKLSWICIPHI